jgi:hypothetical protein
VIHRRFWRLQSSVQSWGWKGWKVGGGKYFRPRFGRQCVALCYEDFYILKAFHKNILRMSCWSESKVFKMVPITHWFLPMYWDSP